MEEFQSLSGTPSASVIHKKSSDGFNLKEEIYKYLQYWKWIVLSVVICVIICLIYLRYTTPIYSASTSILVKDDRKGGLYSELAAFEDLGFGKNFKSNLDNETVIMSSYTLMHQTVKKLNLNVSYYALGRFHVTEMYKDSPIKCTILQPDELFDNKYQSIIVNGIDDTRFEILDAAGNKKGIFTYGKLIPMQHCKIVVEKNVIKNYFDKDYNVKIVISRLDDVINKYRSRVEIVNKGKNSSVIDVKMTDVIRERAVDILDNLIAIYNQDAIDDKSYVSKRTEQFIDDRLKLIAEELGDVERDAEIYKKSNRITDITSEAGIYLQNAVLYERNLIDLETQITVNKTMIDYMNKVGPTELVPINILTAENSAASLIGEFNQNVIERNRLLKGGTEKNVAIVKFERKIEELRANILESLQTQLEILEIRKRDIEKQNRLTTGRISQVPTKEREFRIIDRQQKIKESLYIYLLQKREEIGISLQLAAPNAKVVDAARATKSPIAPNRTMFYGLAVAIGVLIPLLVLYIRNLLDNKVRRRQDIEKQTNIPFLGNIPRLENPQNLLDIKDRSGAAEAFRIIRLNLDFMLVDNEEEKAKTIFVTSTVAKEGKTSVATNLASIISLSGKKVLLVGLDIRNPQIHRYLDVPKEGFTNFISQKQRPIDDFIYKVANYENLHVLPAGAIPPNPSELLMSDGVAEVFATLKTKFDYIVVDTAPVSLVADTLLISKFADVTLYVMRAHFIEKSLLPLAQSFYAERKLPNMAVVLNDTIKGAGYGYGYYGYGDYGYGYTSESNDIQPWWKRLFKRN